MAAYNICNKWDRVSDRYLITMSRLVCIVYNLMNNRYNKDEW